MDKKTDIIAHRGSSFIFPENTLIAFDAALNEGADGIELDVHLTRDGVPIVIHDESFLRTSMGTYSDFVFNLSFEETQVINVANHKADDVCLPPSLEEVLIRYKDSHLIINIELKTDVIKHPNISALVLDVCNKTEYPLNKIIFSSFNLNTLLELKALDSNLNVAFLFKRYTRGLRKTLKKAEIREVHPHFNNALLPFFSRHYLKDLCNVTGR